MKQTIDMGGFKNEFIDVIFGEDTYQIKLDPPIEIYRQLLEIVSKKLLTENDWDQAKNIVVDFIHVFNPQVNKTEFFESLTKTAVMTFIKSFTEMMFKSSDLKNSSKPQSEAREEETIADHLK